VIVVGYLMIRLHGERVTVRPSYLGKLAFMQLACVIAVLARAGNLTGRAISMRCSYRRPRSPPRQFVPYMYRGLVWLRSREPQMFE